jgi:asparagine synthase (glutamine-hydrolysing)
MSFAGTAPDPGAIERMTELVAHRGPDDVGYFFDRNVAFGFRRLSILDLGRSGHQPMISHDGRFVIVYNGEIYNYVELRDALRNCGHQFGSTGDTEVLLTAFQEWGTDCLQRLNGMWSFLVYDKQTQRMFGARDRFGVKPLYVHRTRDAVLLASEIKSIRDGGLTNLSVDWKTAASFLVQGRLDHTSETFYEGVQAIPPGHAFSVDRDGTWKLWRYWNLDDAVGSRDIPIDPVQTFAELFEDAVRIRLRSDVPVGVLLSGGLDSTSIMCSTARQLPPGSALSGISFSTEEFDERTLIQATQEQTGGQVRYLELGSRDYWDSIAEHLWFQDEPVHSFASVVGFSLMRLARRSGTTVLLNGQAADEILGGYPTYFVEYVIELLRARRFRDAMTTLSDYAAVQGASQRHRLLQRALRFWLGRRLNRIPAYHSLAVAKRRRSARRDSWLDPAVFAHWRETFDDEPRSLNDALRASVEREALPLYLRVEDRNSSAHATEVRLPFLDYRLVALAFRLGSEWKLRHGVGKHLLRESMRGRIPEVVRARTIKFGFPIPTETWFRDELYEPMRDLLESRELRESGIWNVPAIVRDLERHRRGDVSVGGQLFNVAQFSIWWGSQAAWRNRATQRSVSAAI